MSRYAVVARRFAVAAASGPWTPASLGSKRKAHWDASRTDLITQSGGTVQTWTDIVGGLAPTQGTGSRRPAYNATGLSGGPCLTFDGVDDYLRLGSLGSLPTGSTGCDVYILGVSDLTANGSGYPFYYGVEANDNEGRACFNQYISSSNRARAQAGNGLGDYAAAYATGSWASAAVARFRFISSGIATALENDSYATDTFPSGSLATGTSSPVIGIGAQPLASSSFFAPFKGRIKEIIVTDNLSGSDETNMIAYGMATV